MAKVGEELCSRVNRCEEEEMGSIVGWYVGNLNA